jgi:uncharacterized protein YeaO (DUF488 family)
MVRIATDEVEVRTPMGIKLKRMYDTAERSDGVRILVDRLWPRGISKDEAAIDEWMKDLAPSTRLRTWFSHKPERWPEFRKRYRRELGTPEKKKMLENIRRISTIATVTLLYATKDTNQNNAVALAELLKRRQDSRK